MDECISASPDLQATEPHLHFATRPVEADTSEQSHIRYLSHSLTCHFRVLEGRLYAAYGRPDATARARAAPPCSLGVTTQLPPVLRLGTTPLWPLRIHTLRLSARTWPDPVGLLDEADHRWNSGPQGKAYGRLRILGPRGY